MDKCVENSIEFLVGQDVATCTFSTKKWINKIKKLSTKFPDEIKIDTENLDGSIVAHIPVSCLHIKNPKSKKDLTEEEKKVIRERFNKSNVNRTE